MKTEDYSINKLAEITGHDRRTIKSRLGDAKPCREAAGVKFYAATDVLPLLRKMPSELTEKRALEIRKLKAQCRELDLDFQIKAGQFISMEEVKKLVVQLVFVVKGRMLQIPSSVAPYLAGKDMTTIADELTKRIRSALLDLTNHKWNQAEAENNHEQKTNADKTSDPARK